MNETTPATTTLAPTASPAPIEDIFLDAGRFELIQRVAKMFSQSEMIPQRFRGKVADCVIAIDMANRLRANPMAVMQSLYNVYGNPGWMSTWIISCINTCGRFEPLMFDLQTLGQKAVEYEYTVYTKGEGGQRGEKERKKGTQQILDKQCIAWTTRCGFRLPEGVATLAQAKAKSIPVYESPAVTVELAVKEGWYNRSDSKWRTMPELMLHYRAATFFGRIHAPELLMGMKSAEELEDFIDITATAVNGEQPKVPGQPSARFSAEPTAKLEPQPQPQQPDAKPEPEKTPPPVPVPAEPKPEAEKAAEKAAQPQAEPTKFPPTTPQEHLADFMSDAGVSFDDFRGFISGQNYGHEYWKQLSDPDSIAGYDQLPTALVETLIKDVKVISKITKTFGKKAQ